MMDEPHGINPIMPNQTGPPVLIPEGGLTLTPAIAQAAFIIAAPLIAGVALLLPALIIAYLVSSLILFLLKKYYEPYASHELDITPLQESLNAFPENQNEN